MKILKDKFGKTYPYIKYLSILLPIISVLLGALDYLISIKNGVQHNSHSIASLQSSIDKRLDAKDVQILTLQKSLSDYVQSSRWMRDNEIYKNDFRQDENKENLDINQLNDKVDKLSQQTYLNSGKIQVILEHKKINN